MQVYLPDDLYNLVKTRGLPASELLQKAVKAELRRLELLAETERYVVELLAEVGPPSVRQRARAQRGAAPGEACPPSGLTAVLVLDGIAVLIAALSPRSLLIEAVPSNSSVSEFCLATLCYRRILLTWPLCLKLLLRNWNVRANCRSGCSTISVGRMVLTMTPSAGSSWMSCPSWKTTRST